MAGRPGWRVALRWLLLAALLPVPGSSAGEPCALRVLSVVRPLSWAPGRLLPRAVPRRMALLPVRLYHAPGGTDAGPVRLLLPRYVRLVMHPRTALVVGTRCITLIFGTLGIDTRARPTAVRAGRGDQMVLSGRATLQVPRDARAHGARVLLHSGTLEESRRVWPGPLALARCAGRLGRTPWPRRPTPPAGGPGAPRAPGPRHLRWLIRDLWELAGLRTPPAGWPCAPRDLDRELETLADLEQRTLERMLACAPDQPFAVRTRLLACVLERGEPELCMRAVRQLDVAGALALADHLRLVVAGPASALRRCCASAIARAGDLAALAAGSDLGPTPRRLLGAADALPRRARSGTAAHAQDGSLGLALHAWLAGRGRPLRDLLRSVLDAPGRAMHRSLQERWARAGISRLHLERFLQSGRLPRGLLDLRATLPFARGRRSSGRGFRGPARRLLRLRRRLEERVRRGFLAGTLDAERLACGARLVGGRLLLRDLADRLDRRDARRSGVFLALLALLGRGPSAALEERVGERRAWKLTVAALAPTWIPRGEELVWDEPDR